MAAGNDNTARSKNVSHAGCGQEYDSSNLHAPLTTPGATELQRVNAGAGIGWGSQVDFESSAASGSAAANEATRASKHAGLAAGSQVMHA